MWLRTEQDEPAATGPAPEGRLDEDGHAAGVEELEVGDVQQDIPRTGRQRGAQRRLQGRRARQVDLAGRA